MNIEARKIEFIEKFLELKSEEAISKLEQALKIARELSGEHTSGVMSKEELNRRIDLSESDFSEKRFKSSEELLLKFR